MTDRRKKNIVELTRTTVEEYARAPKLPLVLLLDNVRSMQNVGSLLRTCDAFAVEEVVMAGITGVPPHPEISKSALGAEESVKWRHVEDAAAEVRAQIAQGVCVCVLEQTRGSVPLQDFVPERGRRYMLVVGNEVDGVSQEIVDDSDVCLEIPQCGVKHSLNVAVSGAIALWHFFSAQK
ncbi:MAG: TrmH family RNA methyltransferase [Muribaculaceae bacterium]|nr:TrmH family RNA methyltransferase [Muribaculaceae bacterium]